MVRLIVFMFFLLIPITASAVQTDIVINEIAAYESSDYEWIEIYNKGSESVDITGWKFFEANTNHKLTAYRGSMIIEPGTYAVIANKADKVGAQYPNFTGTLIDSSWSSLSESGESIGLKNGNGETVELFTYIEAKNTALERKSVATADYTSVNWQEHPSSNTIGVKNSNASGEESQKQQKEQQAVPSVWRPGRGSVLINELVSDPRDREEEWVELYNTTNQTVDLSGWTLEDGSGTIVTLYGELGTLDALRYRVILLPDGFLDNAGDSVSLRSVGQMMIDAVTYGAWDDGDLRDNAPRAHDPHSLARISSTFHNREDFRVTATPTKGAANKIVEKQADNTSFPKIIISEFLPHPSLESNDEFIELYNPNEMPVNLTGWRVSLLNGMQYLFADVTLAPKEYQSFARTLTNLPLANAGGERIRLYAPDAIEAIDEVRYGENTPRAMSYARDEHGFFQWTQKPTPDEANIIVQDNHAPSISINGPRTGKPGDPLTFDATDSFDRDGDVLTFQWDFGDMTSGEGSLVHHQYHDEDAYSLILTVSDGKTSIAQFHHIVIEGRFSATPSEEAWDSDVRLVDPSVGISSRGAIPTSPSVIPAKAGIQTKQASSSSKKAAHTIALDRVRSLKSGTRVQVKGIVAVEPSVISENYFYIAGSGIQVWNPKKEFPKLQRGDKISVTGSVRKNGAELAIRTDDASAAVVLGHEEDPLPLETSLAQVGEPLEGELVRVTGTVVDMRWPNIYLKEGATRLRVYIAKSTGIEKGAVSEGGTITVTGIVSETSAGYRILPRDQNDISVSTLDGAVLGEKVTAPRVITLPERQDPKKGLFRYFLVTLIATFIISAGFAIQYYLDRKKSSK